jgi:hypothetical protein
MFVRLSPRTTRWYTGQPAAPWLALADSPATGAAAAAGTSTADKSRITASSAPNRRIIGWDIARSFRLTGDNFDIDAGR